MVYDIVQALCIRIVPRLLPPNIDGCVRDEEIDEQRARGFWEVRIQTECNLDRLVCCEIDIDPIRMEFSFGIPEALPYGNDPVLVVSKTVSEVIKYDLSEVFEIETDRKTRLIP